MKFSGEADARDKLKNPTKTMIIKLLDGMGSLIFDNSADVALKLSSI